MDREKKITEIREVLEKATPGPWVFCEDANDIFSDKTDYLICDNLQTRFDAQLIANAPEWLRFLLNELERLEREYAEERAAHNAHVTELCELEKENRRLREERDKLIEGLRYFMKEFGKVSVSPATAGAGHAYKKMLAILKEIGVTVE